MHIPALDGIRGVAIVLVVVYHSFLYGGMEPTVAVDRAFYWLGRVGWSGVDLFFVLSGFLITGILCDAKGGDGYFRNFYARRILRIFPLYYGFLFLWFVLIPAVGLGPQFISLPQDQAWYWTYLVNVQLTFQGWPEDRALVHFWSLGVEEQFYLIWPLVVFVLRRSTLKGACLGMVIGGIGVRVALRAIAGPTAAYVLTPARMDALALGGLLAVIAREPGGLLGLARWARPVVFASLASLGLLFLWRGGLRFGDRVVQTAGFTLLALLSGGILVIGVTSPAQSAAGRLLAHRFLRLLGRYSYALYVFHHPIMLYAGLVFGAASFPRLAGSQVPGQLVFTAVTASISLAAAALSWHLYESQFLKLKGLFSSDAKVVPGSEGQPAG